MKMFRPPMPSLDELVQGASLSVPSRFTQMRTDRNGELEIEAVASLLEPESVTIHLLAGVAPEAAIAALEAATQWLKRHGEMLPMFTPVEPPPNAQPAAMPWKGAR